VSCRCLQLSYSLIAANRFLPEVLRDERLKPMLENMSKTYTGPEYGAGRKVRARAGAGMRAEAGAVAEAGAGVEAVG
jgi:hypothetical protein